jgi:hypothetical protein
LSSANDFYSYDAAGLTTHIEVPATSSIHTSAGYDADGRQVKTEETTWDEELETEVTETKYYLRSSVLGGQVLTEIFASNAGRTFVYAGQAIIAWQWLSYGWEVVDWEHQDPSGASVRRGGVSQELDPLGGDAGISAQTQIPDEGLLLSQGSSYSPANPNVTYSRDGIRVPADDFMAFAGFELQDTLGLMEDFARQRVRPEIPPWIHPEDVPNVEDRIALEEALLSGKGIPDLLALLPQNLGRQIVPLGNLRKGLEGLLKGDCGVFVQKLIDKANELDGGGRSHATSFWDAFSRIQDAGGYQLDDVASNGGTVSGELFVGELVNPSLPEGPYAGPGTVHLQPFGPIGRSARPAEVANAQARYVYKALHETLHLAKRGWYHDEDLARAGHEVDGTTAPDYKKDDYLSWSENFDTVLQRHCAYPFK